MILSTSTSVDGLSPSSTRVVDRVQGPWVRALWGLKMCASKLLSSKAMTTSDDSSIKAERVEELDTLATKLLLESVYAPDAQYPTPESVRSATRSVLTPSSS